jgi:Fe2+ transport system protein FeoA
VRTLDLQRPSSRCRVTSVLGADGLTQRLMEMGLIEGSTVEVIRLAPMGDPMELYLRGYHLSLRKSEAARIEVEPCA